MTTEHILRKRDIAIMSSSVNEDKNKYVIFVLGKSGRLIKFKTFVEKSDITIKEILKRINNR